MPNGYSYYYAPQYTASNQNAGNSGTGAIFNFIRRDGTTYYVAHPASRFNGINYSVGDSITILGSELGGVDGINDLVFDVIKIDDNGGILQIGNITGTAINSSPENLNKNENLVSVMSNGYGATFDVSINNGVYTVTPHQPGTNYLEGQNFKIKGYKLAHQYLKEGFKAMGIESSSIQLALESLKEKVSNKENSKIVLNVKIYIMQYDTVLD